MLFDDQHRCDKGPATYSESAFAYLNRSARDDVAAAREVLEEWVRRYPPVHRAELTARFRSDDRWHHQSAVFELFLHELLFRLECQPVIHTPVASGRRPDFLLTDPIGNECFLEAALVTGESKADHGARAREQAVYDAINRVSSPDHFVGVQIIQHSEQPIPERKLITFLNQRLTGALPGASAGPLLFSASGWEILLRATPKSARSRGRPGVRPLGYKSSGGQWIDSWPPLRDAIRQKAGRYGELGLPYVIALNLVAEWPPDEIDIGQALFGQEVFTFREGGAEPSFSRNDDGAWRGPAGPSNTRNSAVLLVEGLSAWTLASAVVTLYHHPWAKLPYAGPLTRFRSVSAVGGRLSVSEGEPLHRVIGLAEGWPGPRDIRH